MNHITTRMAVILIASAMLIVATTFSPIARQQQGYFPSTTAQKQTSQQQQLEKENLCLSTGKCSLWIYWPEDIEYELGLVNLAQEIKKKL